MNTQKNFFSFFMKTFQYTIVYNKFYNGSTGFHDFYSFSCRIRTERIVNYFQVQGHTILLFFLNNLFYRL